MEKHLREGVRMNLELVGGIDSGTHKACVAWPPCNCMSVFCFMHLDAIVHTIARCKKSVRCKPRA